MASRNNLIGSGIPYVDIEEYEIVAKKTRVPAWRYHSTCKTGMLVKHEKLLDELDAAGWVDHPAKLEPLPGLEHIYNAHAGVKAEDVPKVIELSEEEKRNSEIAENLLKISMGLEEKRKKEEAEAKKEEEKHVCRTCGKKFDKKQALRMHVYAAHGAKSFAQMNAQDKEEREAGTTSLTTTEVKE